jgi:plastocyanin
MPARVVRCSALALAVVTAGCNGAGTATAPPGPPTYLVKNGGDGQSWYFNNPLPVQLSVQALDASNRGVPGVVVTWATVSGGVSPAQSVTDASGVAGTTDSLGSSSPQTVTATLSIATLPTVTFIAGGTAPPSTAAVSLKSTAFNPQSVVVQTGGTVTWTWNDAPIQHNVNFQSSDPSPRPAGSPTQATGTLSFAFTTVATYHFFCNIHAAMTGTLIVVH